MHACARALMIDACAERFAIYTHFRERRRAHHLKNKNEWKEGLAERVLTDHPVYPSRLLSGRGGKL